MKLTQTVSMYFFCHGEFHPWVAAAAVIGSRWSARCRSNGKSAVLRRCAPVGAFADSFEERCLPAKADPIEVGWILTSAERARLN
jgi:hypothetical protein